MHDDDAMAGVTRNGGGLYPMSLIIVPRGRKSKRPIPLLRYTSRACRDIESITLTALSCSPTDDVWSVSLLEHIASAMRNGAGELERAIELRRAEGRALHQEKLAALRQREAENKGR
jgi:hypothetical protein